LKPGVALDSYVKNLIGGGELEHAGEGTMSKVWSVTNLDAK